MGKVFKVCEKNEWEAIEGEDFFKGTENDKKDGFIHFSTSEQLMGTLEKYFKSKSHLYLLELSSDNLNIVWEVGRNKQLFPHLYQPLPLNSITRVYKIFMDTRGNHIVPDQVFSD